MFTAFKILWCGCLAVALVYASLMALGVVPFFYS